MEPGEIVGGRYALEAHLASGGMGAVWRARHLLSDRRLALKLVHAHVLDAEGGPERFRREASAAATIGHPGIVEVLDAGVDPERGWFYLAMELLEGESLRQRFARPETTVAEALGLLDALLDPLAAAHARGFVHRDLKPENVFVSRQPDGVERVVLLDFGISRRMDAGSGTRTGLALGTPQYMAPEQAMSAKTATPAADVWSFGVVLFEALTGRPPFDGETPHAVLVRACSEPHRPVREAAPHVSEALASLVDRCLEKRPEDRLADAAVLREALAAAVAASDALDAWPRAAPEVTEDGPTISSDAARPISTMPTGPMRMVRGDGWSFEVPAQWADLPSSIPTVVALAGAPASSGRMAPSARLVVEPWLGDLAAYANLGLDNMAASARIHLTQDIVADGRPAVQVDATFHAGDPPFRGLLRCTVHAGRGYVLSCRSAPSELVAHRRLFEKILDSLRIDAA